MHADGRELAKSQSIEDEGFHIMVWSEDKGLRVSIKRMYGG